VENVTALASVLQNIRFAERHQMLGNVGLPPAERGFEVTDAGFACADGEQDGNALRRGNGGQRRGDLFGDLGQDLFFSYS